jgi:hypothetical protein
MAMMTQMTSKTAVYACVISFPDWLCWGDLITGTLNAIFA